MFIALRKIALVLVILAVFGAAPVLLQAEVKSRPCPYSCDTERIPRSQCKDWKRGNICYIDDLRPAPAAPIENDSSLQRKISLVNKVIMASQEINVDLIDKTINRIDLVLRREGGNTQTKIKASIGGTVPLGNQQVDQNTNHVLSFQVGDLNPRGRKLVLSAKNGDVFVESVHILYR